MTETNFRGKKYIKKKKKKIRRGPKLEGCAFADFRNSSGTTKPF